MIITNLFLRRCLGVLCVIVGFILQLLPIVPGIWLVVIGFELLGIRLLIQEKVTNNRAVNWFLRKNPRTTSDDQNPNNKTPAT